jgi:tetratricopeptide (TPR) repeat protein
MIVSLLHKALEASYEKKHPLALKYADTACKLLPDFYEVWRVSAQIKDEAGKIIEARDDFEKALDFADGKSEPLLAHYAKFLQKHDQIDKAIQILSEKALSPSAQPELVIALAWTQTLNKDYKNAIQLFETVYKKIESVSGDQRSFILVQYATALRLAAENERNRKNPDKGFDLIFQSLSVIKELCNSYSVNSAILSTVQKSFKETCRILAMKHVDENWTRLEPVALELSKYILLFDKNEPETRLLHEVYPEIKAKDSFQQILSPTGILKKNEILGTLTRVFVNKDFAYLKGENGQEYFMHQSELKSNIKWDKFNELKNIRIKFTEQALNPKNSATWKKRKYILPRAKSVFLLATIIDSTEDDGD